MLHCIESKTVDSGGFQVPFPPIKQFLTDIRVLGIYIATQQVINCTFSGVFLLLLFPIKNKNSLHILIIRIQISCREVPPMPFEL